MIEIKFRGMTVDDNKMVYGDLLQYRVLPVIFDKNKEQHEVGADTIGQYTGLKDKNDEEIYGGDIVQFLSILGNIRTGEVFLKMQGDISYCFKIVNEGNFGLNSYDANNYEIIGNIYENPELK